MIPHQLRYPWMISIPETLKETWTKWSWQLKPIIKLFYNYPPTVPPNSHFLFIETRIKQNNAISWHKKRFMHDNEKKVSCNRFNIEINWGVNIRFKNAGKNIWHIFLIFGFVVACRQIVVRISMLFHQDVCLDSWQSLGYWKLKKKKNLRHK